MWRKRELFMKATFDAVHLFPISCFITEIDSKICKKIKAEEHTFVENYIEEFNFDPSNDVSKSYASIDHEMLKRYPEVEEAIMEKWQEICESYFDFPGTFAISTSWMTKTYPGGYCDRHNHKNAFYAGVFYFDEYEENGGDLGLYSPIDHLSSYMVLGKTPNDFTAGSHWFRPKHGSLVLFPAYLQHKIGLHKGKKTRYSLAFNIIPTGGYGIADSYYDTAWFKG